jgi:NTP pyrophosphatase (non-canonical NTP hydrolase)
MTLDEIQKQVFQNKVKKGFNVTNVEKEFCYLYGEVAEAFEAFLKKKNDLGEELADIGIYLLGLCEILGFSLQGEIEKKAAVNEKREYEITNGVLVKKNKRGFK